MDSIAQTTAGPWVHRKDRLEIWTAEDAPFPNVPIADVRCSAVGDGEADLNADLIAAAPDLAKACEETRRYLGALVALKVAEGPTVQWHINLVEGALRKAGKLATVAVFALLSLPAFATPPCKVNVNAATPAEIRLLARTGEVLAGRIVAGRPLDAEKLDAVKGVGPSWLAVNGPHVAFSGPTTCTEKVKAAKVAAQAPKP